MSYPEPQRLYTLLLPSYLNRLTSLFRRDDAVDLGPYTVGELKLGYAALMAVFSVHEHLCFVFGTRERYPINSCVMAKTAKHWSELMSRVSGLADRKSLAIVQDLTIADRFWDLHVQCFVPVDENVLAVAPQFPLHSRADENLLRICGHVRPEYFDEASLLKEQEMLDDILPACPMRFGPQSRVALPGPLPDIDLLLVDEENGTVLIAELKWLRKPFAWRERIEREQDFTKGLTQLIKSFLTQNPSHLLNMRIVGRSLNEYARIGYVLVARDQFLWPDSTDHIVVDYEVFKGSVSRSNSLSEMLDALQKYEWLPVEGVDFIVRFEPSVCNGVTLESETFYRVV